jgi:hypothetical protein
VERHRLTPAQRAQHRLQRRGPWPVPPCGTGSSRMTRPNSPKSATVRMVASLCAETVFLRMKPLPAPLAEAMSHLASKRLCQSGSERERGKGHGARHPARRLARPATSRAGGGYTLTQRRPSRRVSRQPGLVRSRLARPTVAGLSRIRPPHAGRCAAGAA